MQNGFKIPLPSAYFLTSQVLVRYVSSDVNVKEEILDLVALIGSLIFI